MRTFRFAFVSCASVLAFASMTIPQYSGAADFVGLIRARITQGGVITPLLYTVGTNFLRIEVTATNRPHPVDLLDRQSKQLTLLFPHNRSFVRLKPVAANDSAPPAGVPARPAMPPGVGPQPSAPPGPAGHIGPTNPPGMPAMPAMPQMPMPREKIELKATEDTTNLLGYACTRYELKQRGETMDIWVTDKLLPFQPYLQNQPHRFGPRMIEQEWGRLVRAKKLFPLLATLKFDNGAERYRFQVTSITAERLTSAHAKLFQPPPNYFEIQPLPF